MQAENGFYIFFMVEKNKKKTIFVTCEIIWNLNCSVHKLSFIGTQSRPCSPASCVAERSCDRSWGPQSSHIFILWPLTENACPALIEGCLILFSSASHSRVLTVEGYKFENHTVRALKPLLAWLTVLAKLFWCSWLYLAVVEGSRKGGWLRQQAVRLTFGTSSGLMWYLRL